MNTLASRLRTTRLEKGFTQDALARRAGVGKSTISSLEQERNRGTTQLVPIARALGVREEWLVSGKGLKEIQMADKFDPEQNYYIIAKTPEELAEQLLEHGDDHVLQLLSLVMQLKAQKGR